MYLMAQKQKNESNKHNISIVMNLYILKVYDAYSFLNKSINASLTGTHPI